MYKPSVIVIKITGFLYLFLVLIVEFSHLNCKLLQSPVCLHMSHWIQTQVQTTLEHPEVKHFMWLTMKALILQDVLFQWSFRPTASLLITVNQSLLGPCWPKHLRRQKTSCSSWHLQVITHGDSGVWKNNLRTDAKKRGAFLFCIDWTIFWSLSALGS